MVGYICGVMAAEGNRTFGVENMPDVTGPVGTLRCDGCGVEVEMARVEDVDVETRQLVVTFIPPVGWMSVVSYSGDSYTPSSIRDYCGECSQLIRRGEVELERLVEETSVGKAVVPAVVVPRSLYSVILEAIGRVDVVMPDGVAEMMAELAAAAAKDWWDSQKGGKETSDA